MIAVSKGLIIRSSFGAAATLIDARTVNVSQAVLVSANSAEFGRPGQGFTVTNTLGTFNTAPYGITINSDSVSVRGNQVFSLVGFGIGINVPCSTGVVHIEDNQVMGWTFGIEALCANKTVSRNALLFNLGGVVGSGGTVTDNVALGNLGDGVEITAGSASTNIVAGNGEGLAAGGGGILSGNAAFGNQTGVLSFSDGGAVNGNNVIGSPCGLARDGTANVDATNNYWGAATGPGAAPADGVCIGPATASPFAATPFSVVNPVPAPSVYRINAGGPSYTGAGGVQWQSDAYFNTGTTVSKVTPIANTTDDVLYESQRTNTSSSPELTYSLAVPAGTYQVKLHFAELVLKGAGLRTFNVKLNGATVLTNFDVFATAGQLNQAVTKTFTTTVTNGELTIQFLHVVGDPIISAIEVLPQ